MIKSWSYCIFVAGILWFLGGCGGGENEEDNSDVVNEDMSAICEKMVICTSHLLGVDGPTFLEGCLQSFNHAYNLEQVSDSDISTCAECTDGNECSSIRDACSTECREVFKININVE